MNQQTLTKAQLKLAGQIQTVAETRLEIEAIRKLNEPVLYGKATRALQAKLDRQQNACNDTQSLIDAITAVINSNKTATKNK